MRPRSPIGRGKPLKRATVWVRLPPGAPRFPGKGAFTWGYTAAVEPAGDAHADPPSRPTWQTGSAYHLAQPSARRVSPGSTPSNNPWSPGGLDHPVDTSGPPADRRSRRRQTLTTCPPSRLGGRSGDCANDTPHSVEKPWPPCRIRRFRETNRAVPPLSPLRWNSRPVIRPTGNYFITPGSGYSRHGEIVRQLGVTYRRVIPALYQRIMMPWQVESRAVGPTVPAAPIEAARLSGVHPRDLAGFDRRWLPLAPFGDLLAKQTCALTSWARSGSGFSPRPHSHWVRYRCSSGRYPSPSLAWYCRPSSITRRPVRTPAARAESSRRHASPRQDRPKPGGTR